MARQIFRQDAVDRMASPDHFDKPVRLISSAQWIWLVSLSTLIVFGLIWSFRVTVPIKTQGQGILIDPKGQGALSSEFAGRIEELTVTYGDIVSAGDPIATLSRADLNREIEVAQAALNDALLAKEKSEEIYQRNLVRQTATDRQLRASIAGRIGDLREQLASRQEFTRKIESMTAIGAASSSELMTSIAITDELTNELRSLEQGLLDIEAAASKAINLRDKERLKEQQAVDAQRRELQKLREQSLYENTVKAKQSGRITAILVNVGDVVTAGTSLATIDRQRADQELDAVLYIPPTHGKRVAVGMAAEINPTTSERVIYGHIRGEVSSVSLLPSSRESLQRYLQNDQLVTEVLQNGAPIEVRVTLKRDEGTPTGYSWSSSSGPDTLITKGTSLTGQIVIERRRIIDLVLPGARERGAHLVRQSFTESHASAIDGH